MYLVHANLCSAGNDLLFADLLATGVFMVGLNTLLQTTLGSRYAATSQSDMTSYSYLSQMLVQYHICRMGHYNMSSMDNYTLNREFNMAQV